MLFSVRLSVFNENPPSTQTCGPQCCELCGKMLIFATKSECYVQAFCLWNFGFRRKYSIAKGSRSTCSGILFISEKSRRLTGYHIYAPDSIKTGITLSEGHAEDICRRVECYSSYVQRLDFTSKLLYLSKNLIKGKKLCAGISPAAAKACSAQVPCNFATGYPAVR